MTNPFKVESMQGRLAFDFIFNSQRELEEPAKSIAIKSLANAIIEKNPHYSSLESKIQVIAMYVFRFFHIDKDREKIKNACRLIPDLLPNIKFITNFASKIITPLEMVKTAREITRIEEENLFICLLLDRDIDLNNKDRMLFEMEEALLPFQPSDNRLTIQMLSESILRKNPDYRHLTSKEQVIAMNIFRFFDFERDRAKLIKILKIIPQLIAHIESIISLSSKQTTLGMMEKAAANFSLGEETVFNSLLLDKSADIRNKYEKLSAIEREMQQEIEA